MATSTRCSMCEKGRGTCLCGACKKHFCMKDFKNHRGSLSNEMDVLVGDCNDLQDKINNASQHKDSGTPLLAQIDEWQQNTIEKVKEAAEQVRQQVRTILSSKRVEITTQFETMSKELVQLKETEDFVEHDLARFRQKIQQLSQDLTLLSQPVTIKLHTEPSDQIVWNSLVYIEENPTCSGNEHSSTHVEGWAEELAKGQHDYRV